MARRFHLALVFVFALLASGLALAPAHAAPAPAPAKTTPAARAPKLTGYPVDVQQEVMMQNLVCEDIVDFVIGLDTGRTPAVVIAEGVLDKPQYSEDTSQTLFGGTLTRLILTASNSPPCTVIVPETYPPTGNACSGSGNVGIPDTSLNATIAGSTKPLSHPGELKLIGMFELAAKLRNCKLP